MEKKKKNKANPEKIMDASAENMEDSPREFADTDFATGAEEKASAGPEAGDAAAEWVHEKEELVCLVQRKQADLDNFRRISRIKEEEIRTYGLHRFLERLLPVLDNIERALAAACDDESVPESYLEGLIMIRKQLQQLLEQEGVVEMGALGKQFDPHYHDAVMQTDSGEGEPGSVVEEFEKGYLYKDRVLRHAKVKVMQSQL